MAKGKKVEPAQDTEASASRVAQAREKFSEVAERARRGGSQVREQAGRAGEAAKEKYSVAVDNLKQGYDKVQTDLDKLTEDVNEYVRGNPGRSVLMAAGIGFFVGLLLRGRRH